MEAAGRWGNAEDTQRGEKKGEVGREAEEGECCDAVGPRTGGQRFRDACLPAASYTPLLIDPWLVASLCLQARLPAGAVVRAHVCVHVCVRVHVCVCVRACMCDCVYA